jgi:hypothetical protein
VATQIDFILSRKNIQKSVTNSKAIPNAGLDTDHRPVLIWSHAYTTRTHRKQDPKIELINMKKLEEEQIKEQVRVSIQAKLEVIDDSR